MQMKTLCASCIVIAGAVQSYSYSYSYIAELATGSYILYAKQKHLGCKKGEANQKQQLSDYKYTHSYTCD